MIQFRFQILSFKVLISGKKISAMNFSLCWLLLVSFILFFLSLIPIPQPWQIQEIIYYLLKQPPSIPIALLAILGLYTSFTSLPIKLVQYLLDSLSSMHFHKLYFSSLLNIFSSYENSHFIYFLLYLYSLQVFYFALITL